MNFSGKFVYYNPVRIQTPSFILYHTSDHDHYYEGERLSFNKPAVNQVDWRLLDQHIVSKQVHSF